MSNLAVALDALKSAERVLRTHPEGVTPEQAQRLLAVGILSLLVFMESLNEK